MSLNENESKQGHVRSSTMAKRAFLAIIEYLPITFLFRESIFFPPFIRFLRSDNYTSSIISARLIGSVLQTKKKIDLQKPCQNGPYTIADLYHWASEQRTNRNLAPHLN